jgi:hypothetical protein
VELKKAINDKIGPWIKSQRDTVSLYWKQNNSKQEKNLIDTLKGNCRKLINDKSGKKPLVNINLVRF